jgi:hypothetical protein
MHRKADSRIIIIMIAALCCTIASPALADNTYPFAERSCTENDSLWGEFDGSAFGNALDGISVEPLRKAWTNDAITPSQAKELLNRQVLHPQRTGWDKLDARIGALLDESGASDTYGKLWYAYQWLVRNVTYSWAGYSNTNASVAAYNSFTGYNYLSSSS